MIADDERLIRQLVKKSVNWSELDMSVMWEAKDGQVALQMIRENTPDIAIVDINMPFTNGIDLAKTVREENLATRIVFLTGYQEFEYAQKAIEYGVFGYILKPIRPEELSSVLKRLGKQILQERNQTEVSPSVKRMDQLRRLASGRPMEKGEVYPESWDELFRKKYCVLVLRPDGVQQLANLQALLMQILQKAWTFLEKDQGYETMGYLEADKYDVLVLNAEASEKGMNIVLRVVEALRRHMEKTEGHTVTIGVSSVHSGADELNMGLQEAVQAAAGRFNGSNNRVYVWEPRLAEQEAQMRVRAQEILEILDTFSRKSLLKREDNLDELLKLIEEKNLSEDYSKILAVRLSAITMSFEKGVEYGIPFSQFYGAIMRCERLEEVQKLCHQWMQYEREQYLSVGAKKYSKLIQSSKAYITQNYADHKLSLNQIATVLNVNPAYLSNLFKQEMEITITEYITACRMGRAAEILNHTPDCTLAELSDQVGYNDPYYFSRSFKKYYGVSPLRYRLENDG